ncbi:helix-turn-helix transcriptional regulator [Streptomyces sp. NBC_00094]|uniref:helix-turn-helix domain-containing protein n=1 Tax=Streptomyces sp. NBC_00094 TaxID=2903620 RepID=UPI00225A25B1|nr:helix-turn-helix transcriptional regulator [Streptomyces sp. NBC_00094]MCX5393272.1 helix-turn-helix domain-containing protein [Streptomyces sp. NBC_00094]
MTPGERAPDPREARNTAEFLARLQALKDWSGLTYRELSARAETHGEVLPRSTVANMLARATVPREELLTTFVRACGVGPSDLEEWQAVRRELAVRGVYAPVDGHPAGAGAGAEAEAEVGAEAEAEGDAEVDGTAPAPDTAPAPSPGPAPSPAPGPSVVWPRDPDEPPEDAPEPRPGPRSRIGRGLVATVALAGLVLAGVSVVAFLRDGHGAHPPRTLTAPAAGDVRIRVIGPDLCLGERRGSRTGQIHQVPCPDAKVPSYGLEEAGGGRWRILSDHPDYGPGCSGIPSGGRIPDAAYEDSECGDPSRVEEFALEPYGTPVEGYRIVPAGSATPGSCVTVVGDREAAWARLAQAPCAPDAAGQLFSFDRRS